MCMIPRMIVANLASSLRTLKSRVKPLVLERSTSHIDSWRGLLDTLESTALPLEAFLGLLVFAETQIQEKYKANKLDEMKRATMERDMLVTGEIPTLLLPVLQEMFTRILVKIAAGVNFGRLFDYDASLAGLTSSSRRRAETQGKRWDVVRKVLLPPDARIKRCARDPTHLAEDLPWIGKPPINYLGGAWRSCVCGGNFISVVEN